MSRATESVAAAMMAAMFLTFILQIAVRYTARIPGIAERLPLLDPTRYGWTLEFCLALWVWLVFWGNAFIVRERDHVTFDVLYNHVRPATRRWFAIIGAVVICIGLLWSLEPTWSRFAILRLKKTATLSQLFGDWIRMRHIYAIYALFLIVVALRYAWRAGYVWRHGAEEHEPHSDGRLDE
ncbi:TRAP transporter small permease [Sulfitobacter sp. D35]|uniref:TRAP transporter small permease n=1 Tax=Sulfitobacter sp. D35 TaxID=3083252 RepID=UPI00296F92F6|nr:TRAP transporter small permease subunit [Sulfitobacter sp. D35]